MAKFERGVYEPSDEVRVFDGSEDDDDVEGSRLPLLIVLALLVLAMFGGVVWLAYTQGVARGRGETPVLTAAAGPEKIAPSQPGGSNVPYQGFKIYEQPAPSDDSADAAPPPPAKPEAARIDTAQADAAPPLKQQTAPVETRPAPPAAKVEPQKVVAPPTKQAPAPVKIAAPPPKSVAALIQQANTTPPPPAKAAPVPATSVPAGPATGAPRQLGAPVAAATKPAPVAAKPAAGGAYVLQIGAYKSQADADAAWKAYKAKHAALLSGYSPDVQQAQLGEKGTWYRLRIAGFSDKGGASATCDRLKADGGNCFLGK